MPWLFQIGVCYLGTEDTNDK